MEVAVLEPRDVLRAGLAAMLERLLPVGSLECHRCLDEFLGARKARGKEGIPDIFIVSDALDDTGDRVRSMFPASRLLELLVRGASGDLAMAAEMQADGYLTLDDITEATLNGTLQALMHGELPMSLSVASRVQPYFSPRERDVISLLLKGLSNQQIARQLHISLHSAKRHVSAVLHKVNSPSRTHFVAWVLQGDQDVRDGHVNGAGPHPVVTVRGVAGVRRQLSERGRPVRS